MDFGTARYADSKSRSRQASTLGTASPRIPTASSSTLSSSFDGKGVTSLNTAQASPLGPSGIIPFMFSTDEIIEPRNSKYKYDTSSEHKQGGERSLRRFQRGISVAVDNLMKIWDFFELTDEGGIDKVGFEIGLHQLGVEEGACNLDNVFTELDENDDKIIDKNEFSRLVKSDITKLSPEVAKLRKAIERTVKYLPSSREHTIENMLQSDFPLKEMDETIKGESGSDSEPRIKRNMCKDVFRSLDFRHQGYLDAEEFLVVLSRLKFQDVEKYRSTFDQYVMFQSPIIDLDDLMTLVLYISGDDPLEPRLWDPLKERDIRLVFEDLDNKDLGLTAFEVGLAAERLGILTQTMKDLFPKHHRCVNYSEFNAMIARLGNNDRCHPIRRPKIPTEPHHQINKVFKQLDHNSSGTISEEEFRIGCRWLGLFDQRNNISEFQYRCTDGKINRDSFQGAIESLWVRHDIQISRLSERLSFDIRAEASKCYIQNMNLLDLDSCHYINLAESIVAAQRMDIKFDLSWIQTHFATYDYTSSGWIHRDLLVSLMAELETKSDPTKSRYGEHQRDRHRPTRESYGSAHVKAPDMNLQPSSKLRTMNLDTGSTGSSPLVSGKRFPSNRSDGSRTSIRFDKIKSLLYSPRDVELKTQEKLQTLEIKKCHKENEELKKKINDLNTSLSKAETQSRLHKGELEIEKEKLSLKAISIESSRDQKLAVMAKLQSNMDSELQEHISEVRELKKRLAESESEKVQLQREIREELAELEDDYCELEAEAEMCMKENNLLKDELEEIQRKYRDLEEEFESMGEKNAELREEMRNTRKDHKEMSKKYKMQQDKLKEFEMAAYQAMGSSGRQDSVLSRHRDSEFKVKTFNETLKFLHDHTKIMSEFKEIWKDKKNSYKRRIIDLKNEIKHLRKNYEKLRKTLTLSRVESAFTNELFGPGKGKNIGGAPLNMEKHVKYSYGKNSRMASHVSQHRRGSSFEI